MISRLAGWKSPRAPHNENVGVTRVGERVWLVTFTRDDCGYFDGETCRLEPIDNPFRPKKVLPMSSEWTVTHVSVMDPEKIGSSGWIRTSNPPVNRRKKKR